MPRRGPKDLASKETLLARLRSVEGHLRGVTQMIDEDGYCIDILRQTKAIHAALTKVETLLLDRHLHHCVTTAVRSEKAHERERVLGELLDLFEAKGGKSR